MSPCFIMVKIRTLFANLEQFISLPCNHTASQSAPTPFHHTAQDLSPVVLLAMCFFSPILPGDAWFLTIGSVSRNSCINSSPLTGAPLSNDWLK